MQDNQYAGLSRVIAATLLFVPGLALAVLGGDEVSIQAGPIPLEGTVSIRQTQHYALHEIRQPSGTAVRQYVSPAGKVFAVAWQGPTLPDLKQVLGPYFDRYVAAAKDKRAKRAPVVIRDGSLVVVTGGHPRAFTGRAYLPGLVPPDVDAEMLP